MKTTNRFRFIHTILLRLWQGSGILLMVGLAGFLSGPVAEAANTPVTFSTSQTDFSIGANYSTAITPTAATTSDVVLSGSYSTTTFTINGAALNFGTLNDLDTTQSLVISNANATAGSITLNTASNSVSGTAGDLLYVKSGANLAIQSGAGILTLNLAANGNINNAGTLSISAPVSIATGDTIAFTGAGVTTVGGNIAATSGAINVNDAGGSVILSGTNLYTGLTTVTSGTLQLGPGGSINSGNALTTNAGGVFDINGNAQTLGLLNNGGIVTNSGAGTTLTMGNGSTGAGSFTGAMNIIWNQGAASTAIGGAGFTNTGSLTLNANGAGTITLSGAVNNTGAITNSGAGSGGVTIANIGGNVTGVTENSTTSSLTLSGSNSGYAGTTTLTAGRMLFNVSGNTTVLGSGTFAITSGTFDAVSGANIVFTTTNAQDWNGNFTDNGSHLITFGTGAIT
ncbi:MAG: hypothetical protein WCD79_11800, partial [Chthoniobacteraceae bacterium]